MYKILIVEDEILIASLLQNYIENNNYKCCGIAIDFDEAIAILENKTVDLVLLDITIFGKKNGIDIGHYINKNYNIPFIYLTSHSDTNTLKSLMETNPIAYLSKPFKEIDVVTSLNLYFSNKKVDDSVFNLTIGKTIYNIKLNELIYAESDHVYTNLYFKDKKLLVRKSLTKLTKVLPENTLIRISRSIAVNSKLIHKINKNTLEINGMTFKLSESYKNNLVDLQI